MHRLKQPRSPSGRFTSRSRPRTGEGTPQDGLSKFDLTQWNETYFDRLKDFIRQAESRGIVVELVLFCTLYEDVLWQIHPMSPENNVNRLGDVQRGEVFTLEHEHLTWLHEKFVRKIVGELNSVDNLYFELSNEPYHGSFTHAWKKRVIGAMVETETHLPKQHLIAQDVANGSAAIEKPPPRTSVFNFHYATDIVLLVRNRE